MLILEWSQGCYGRTDGRKRYYIPWRGDNKVKKNVRCIRYAPVISLYVYQVFPVVYKGEFVCISDNYTFTKSALHTKTIPVREH
jgi:hypothetical protein